MPEHKFWGQVNANGAGFSSKKTYTIPYFKNTNVEVFLGEEFDEDGEEIETVPTPNNWINTRKRLPVF